jgi:hypothetical protein
MEKSKKRIIHLKAEDKNISLKIKRQKFWLRKIIVSHPY